MKKKKLKNGKRKMKNWDSIGMNLFIFLNFTTFLKTKLLIHFL